MDASGSQTTAYRRLNLPGSISMDQVKRTREEIVITKHGRPVAKLVPIPEGSSHSIIGFMKGSVQVVGDIVSPLDENWEVL